MKTLYIATWVTDDGSSEFYQFIDESGQNEHDLSFSFIDHYARENGQENEPDLAFDELKISPVHESYDIKTGDRYVIRLDK